MNDHYEIKHYIKRIEHSQSKWYSIECRHGARINICFKWNYNRKEFHKNIWRFNM